MALGNSRDQRQGPEMHPAALSELILATLAAVSVLCWIAERLA